MSQHQRVLAFVNSKDRSRRTKLDSVKCRPLRVNSSGLSLAAKVVQLAVNHPDAAVLIEQLIDDVLSDRPIPYPIE